MPRQSDDSISIRTKERVFWWASHHSRSSYQGWCRRFHHGPGIVVSPGREMVTPYGGLTSRERSAVRPIGPARAPAASAAMVAMMEACMVVVVVMVMVVAAEGSERVLSLSGL